MGKGPCQVEPLKVLTVSHTHTRLWSVYKHVYISLSAYMDVCQPTFLVFLLAFGSHFYLSIFSLLLLFSFYFLDPIEHPYFNSSSAMSVHIPYIVLCLCTNTKRETMNIYTSAHVCVHFRSVIRHLVRMYYSN